MMMMGFYAEDQFQLNNDQAFVVVATLLTFTYMGVTAPGFQGISAGARLGTIAGYPPDYLVWLASEIGKKNKKHLTADSFYDLTVSNVQELILNAYWNNIGLINLVRSFRYIEMSKDEDLTELASNLINEIIQFKLDQNNKRILRSK